MNLYDSYRRLFPLWKGELNSRIQIQIQILFIGFLHNFYYMKECLFDIREWMLGIFRNHGDDGHTCGQE